MVEEPPNFLPEKFNYWDEYLLHLADIALAPYWDNSTQMYTNLSWRQINNTDISHPLAAIVAPYLDPFGIRLTLPAIDYGAAHVPLVQWNGLGASEHMTLSPNYLGRALFNMPGGNSGNPVSPYFDKGHELWLEGQFRPFLPGTPEASFRLIPATHD